MRMRNHGGLAFAQLQDGLAELQVMLTADACGAAPLDHWRRLVDIGDHVSVTGEVVTSRRGELSIAATELADGGQVPASVAGQAEGVHRSGGAGPAARTSTW